MNTVLLYPTGGETVDICAVLQHEFDNCRKFKDIKKLILKEACKAENAWDNTTPAPVEFKWESDLPESILEISEDTSFASSIKYSVSSDSMQIYNLKKGTEYFWRVNNCKAERFVTDSVMPRWIAADGTGNVRDMGGRNTAEGYRIKQGLIYRGQKLENEITDRGREQLKNLGIKTELDLRKESADVVTCSQIDKDVNYVRIACNGYDEFIQNDIKNGTCKKLIEFLANAENYPIYFHCHGGQDRTGTLAFLLDAILGLDDEALLREYELTMLSCPEQKLSRSRKGKFKPFIRYIKKKGKRKNTLRENTMLFLKSANVADVTIMQIRNNLLEK